jgi:hypothetical protein
MIGYTNQRMAEMTIHSIVLAVNNPPKELVDTVVNMHLGGGWRSVWCADVASLDKLPPAEGRIRYIVVGEQGSLTLADIQSHICRDRRDIAAWGSGARRFGL